MFLGTGKRFGLVFGFIAIPVSKQGSNVPKILCSYQCTHHIPEISIFSKWTQFLKGNHPSQV
jgi:hypothetical protein